MLTVENKHTDTFLIDGFLIDGSGYLYIRNFPDRARGISSTAVFASARTLRVVTMVAVTRLVWLDSARALRVVAVVEFVGRLARRARSGRCSWRLTTINILLPHPRY